MYGALLLFDDEFIHIVAISFSALILTELLMVALTARKWHILMILGELVSLALYVASLAIFHEFFGIDSFLGGVFLSTPIIHPIFSFYLQIRSSSERQILYGKYAL